jgi:heptosyltransferase-2
MRLTFAGMPMKILIIQTAFIGDVVLATPLIEKLKEKFKDCTIDFLLRKGNESLLHNHPHIHRVFILDKKKNKYTNVFRLINDIRAESYDYAINLQRFLTTGVITSLSGAKVKIGFDKNPLSFLFTHALKHQLSKSNSVIHEVDRNLSLIQSIVGDNEFEMPKLYPSASDYEIIPGKNKYICIAPSSVWFTKQFPASKWCELIDKIPDRYIIYLIGAQGDIDLCEEIQKNTESNKVEILAGKLTLLQSVALIEKAEMTFVNDSAPLHFASARNAPVTAIFCSTVPAFGFGPLSVNSHVVEVDEKLDCKPCGLHGKKKCPRQHFKCSHIDVGKILTQANLGAGSTHHLK